MDYFTSKAFHKHRDSVLRTLEKIPSAESPKNWEYRGSFAIGGLEYLGFSEFSELLFVASSQGRGLFDLSKNERIARDDSTEFEIDEVMSVCSGFEALQGKCRSIACVPDCSHPTTLTHFTQLCTYSYSTKLFALAPG